MFSSGLFSPFQRARRIKLYYIRPLFPSIFSNNFFFKLNNQTSSLNINSMYTCCRFEGTLPVDNKNKCIRSSLFVKVCLDGNSMCRKLDLLAHDGYSSLIPTLSHMFNTTTLCTYIYVYIYNFLNNLKTELYCSFIYRYLC